MSEKAWILVVGGLIALFVLVKKAMEPTAKAVAPPAMVTHEIIGAAPYPMYPTPTPAPTPEPEPEYEFPTGPSLEESYEIGYNWMLNYFENTDPGTVPADWSCHMEHIKTDTLRSPYSWAFTFDYVCYVEGGGTGTYRRVVNVVQGIPSIGY